VRVFVFMETRLLELRPGPMESSFLDLIDLAGGRNHLSPARISRPRRDAHIHEPYLMGDN
jgi:hypothetical protein